MRFADINAALVQLYQSAQTGLPTFWPSVEYDPAPGQPHARVFWITNQPIASSVGFGGLDAHTGIMQIDLYYPSGTGIGDAIEAADGIARTFVGGTITTYNTQDVHVLSCGIRQPENTDGWLRVICSIAWAAYVPRGEI